VFLSVASRCATIGFVPERGDEHPHIHKSREEVMKAQYSAALAFLAGIGTGAIALHTVYGQSKPPVYVVSEIDVTTWMRTRKTTCHWCGQPSPNQVEASCSQSKRDSA
jgi:hypothetical protein